MNGTTDSVRLPLGVRDFLPRAAARRRSIGERCLAVFERWGYRRILAPAFEYEDVLARGLGHDVHSAAIRFVEPLTGEVVALPTDITPQVARMAATPLPSLPTAPLSVSGQPFCTDWVMDRKSAASRDCASPFRVSATWATTWQSIYRKPELPSSLPTCTRRIPAAPLNNSAHARWPPIASMIWMWTYSAPAPWVPSSMTRRSADSVRR